MDSFCGYCICALQSYLTVFYPKEIIMYIISMMYNSSKVFCGPYSISFIINGDVYCCRDSNLVMKKQFFSKEKIDSVYYGMQHTIFIERLKKEIYSLGCNSRGQLGLKDNEYRHTPQKIIFNFGSKIISVVCGYHDYTIVVTKLDEIYGWGDNESGQLGLGDTTNRNFPHKLPIKNVKSVSCGWRHTIILTHNGKVFACGQNCHGQLGLGNYTNQYFLQKISICGVSNILLISCGYYHTIALTSDGIYSWGDNNHGQLGLDVQSTWMESHKICMPRKINLLCSSIIPQIIAIAGGVRHTMMLTDRGELFVCGSNDLGQLGIGKGNGTLWEFQKLNLNEHILSVNCGSSHVIVTTKSGKYYGWGFNTVGQLGLGDGKNRYIPTEIVIRI